MCYICRNKNIVMDKMTKEQAAELLTNYQQWRKGRVDYFPVSPAKLSQAIDLAIENLMQSDVIKAGDKVSYVSNLNYGIVKECDHNGIRVVFSCGGDWENYQNYAGATCDKGSIVKGWPKNAK